MPHVRTNKMRLTAQSPRRARSSNSVILVLSGFLIGIVSTECIPQNLKIFAWSAGTLGLIAYYVTGRIAQTRNAHQAALAHERASHKLESRVSKHVPRRMPGRKPPANESRRTFTTQYIPVVQSPLSRRG